MKTYSPLRQASLSLILLSLTVSCQGFPVTVKQPSNTNAFETSLRDSLHGRMTLSPQKNGTTRVVVRLTLPKPTSLGTQALPTSDIAYIRASVSGLGISTPIYTDGSDGQNMVANSGGNVTLSFATVLQGEARLITISAYDSNRNSIPGSTIKGVFDATSGTVSGVEVSYRTTPGADIIQSILGAGGSDFLATQLDLAQLQSFVDAVSGKSGSSPNYTYTIHPTLIDAGAIAQDLIANGGNLGALTPSNPSYQISASVVTGAIAGLVGGDTATIQVTDPASAISSGNGNGAFSLSGVKFGTWLVRVSGGSGTTYTVSNTPSATLGSGETVSVGTITLTPVTPSITSLSPSSGPVGGSVTINGTGFHATDSAVQFGTISVPAGDITYISSNQIRVKVPNGASGTLPVTVGVGSQTSNASDFTVTAGASTPLIGSPTRLTSLGNGEVLTSGIYNSVRDEYLVLFERVDPDRDIYARRVSTTGEALGSPIAITTVSGHQWYKKISFNPTNNEYMLVWDDYRNYPQNDVYGQRLNSIGEKIGSEIPIAVSTSNSELVPAIAYNSVNDEYMIVWNEHTADYSDNWLVSQRYSTSGIALGAPTPIVTIAATNPEIVFNPDKNQYLMTYSGWGNGEGDAIILDSSGAAISSAIEIAPDAGNNKADLIPVYNSVDKEYLVSWLLYVPPNNTLYYQRLNSLGGLLGTNQVHALTTIDGFSLHYPRPVYNPKDNEYLIAWWDQTKTSTHAIFASRISNSGAIIGEMTNVTTTEAWNSSIACNSSTGEYLALWTANPGLGTSYDVYGQLLAY